MWWFVPTVLVIGAMLIKYLLDELAASRTERVTRQLTDEMKEWLT